MFRSSQSHAAKRNDDSDVNMTPLIDMVFILLIFFLVTAHFKPDEGIQIDRPLAKAVKTLPTNSLRVAIAPEGALYLDGRPIDLGQLRQRARAFKAENPEGTATVAPDKRTASGRLVAVMDAIKMEGIDDVAVVTRSGP
jgi:biopolymer transport protein ExbD